MTRLLALLLVASCATVSDSLGVRGGTETTAVVHTRDGADIGIWRWAPRRVAGPAVLLVPELGFDHALVAPLARRLRDAGFDVFTLDGRQVGKGATTAGWKGWLLDLDAAIVASRPAHIIAVGLAGAGVVDLAGLEPVPPLIAVNVPLRPGVGNATLAEALLDNGFDPASWAATPRGPLLLAGGRTTPPSTIRALRSLARPLPEAFALDARDRLLQWGVAAPAALPVRVFAGTRDSVIEPENAIMPPGPLPFPPARRLARMEYFQRDWGHLDWLVEDAGLQDLTPVLVAALEASP